MNTHALTLTALLATASLLASCGGGQAAGGWLSENDVVPAVDETFAPIIDEEAQAFALNHVEATMKPLYVSEDSALHLLMADSVQMAIVTRGLTDKEKEYITSQRRSALQAVIAKDAFALIVAAGSADTLFTLDDLRGIVSGKVTRWEQLVGSHRTGELRLVFDKSGSSTVRFMRDSLNGGKPLSGNVFAQGSNEAVIEAVKTTPGVVGVVGVDWLRAGADSTLKDFDGLGFEVARVSRYADERADYKRPWQYHIATGNYPLVRQVYAICTDPRSKSMLKNFYFFLKGENGQRIICNSSQMLPNTPVYVKQVSVK
ncbi:MAG: substrate-binding domain-containing protein [Bacteroidaceae bacterium]|nr:substrate-binding domain-containing protein [Bacteroidaceae bacterium]